MVFLTFLIETESENIPHASAFFGLTAMSAALFQIFLTLYGTGGWERNPSGTSGRNRLREQGRERSTRRKTAEGADAGSMNLTGQLVVLNLFLALCCLFVCIGAWRNRDNPEAVLLKMSVFAVWTMSSVISFLIAAFRFRGQIAGRRSPVRRKTSCGRSIVRFLQENSLVLVMILAAVLWMIPGLSNALHGDAGLNFRFYHDQRSVFSLTSFRTMDAYTHLGYAYSFGVLMLQGVTGDTGFAMHFWNVVLYILGCLAFYGIIREENREAGLFGRSTILPALAAGIFIFSPYTMGMADDATWDYWTIFLFVILLYCYVRKWNILEAAVGAVFCFTKEPCVIVYAVFVLCCFILDFRENGIRKAVRRWNYWFSLYIGVIWLFLYEVYAHWAYTGGNSFQFDPAYIGERLKTVLFLNFGWVVVILMAVGIVRRVTFRDLLLPAGISWLAFLVFSCTFVTVNNPRYIDCGLVFPYLMAALLIVENGSVIVSAMMGAALSILMLCSVFRTIDPVSLHLFPQMETGNGVQLLIGASWNEGAAYNAQHLYQEDAFNLALADAFRQDPEVQIIFPLVLQNPWYFDGLGLWQEVPEGYCRVTEYWNPETRKRCVYPDSLPETYAAGSVSETGGGAFDLLEVSDIEVLEQELAPQSESGEQELPDPYPEVRTYCCFYTDLAGGELADAIRGRYTVVRESSYTAHNWVMHCVTFR